MKETPKHGSELQLDPAPIINCINVYRAVNSKLRQDMLTLIHKKGRVTVTELFTELKIEQPVASNHLAILRSRDLVINSRVGKNVFYSVNYKKLEMLESGSIQLLNGLN
jgi:DNA-binding transcriptional ArsR family regulator